jgi:hypothetical protein
LSFAVAPSPFVLASKARTRQDAGALASYQKVRDTMPKRKKWTALSETEKTEDLYRQVLDLAGAIQTIRLDLAHIMGQMPKAGAKKAPKAKAKAKKK